MTADGISEFNALPAERAEAALGSCLAVSRWVAEMTANRPYESAAAAVQQARRSAANLSEPEVRDAQARHPRIGKRAGTGHDVAFSEREQAAVAGADATVQDQIRRGNAAYEARFGRVFLIRAKGREPAEILAELNRRLGHDDQAELAQVITELTQIAVGRLEQLVGA